MLLLGKSLGITSNDALQEVKCIYQAKKAGHTGSLDRQATGLLPICFGEATKFTSFLLNADKCYVARCQLGIETATGDAEGKIISERPIPRLVEKDFEGILQTFRGDIEQIPPMYSALKQNGQRLYKLAYQGIEIKREARRITIYENLLVDFTGEQFEIEVRCSKGTYIRTLVTDIGNALGCGAHIITLRRTAIGPFHEDSMTSVTTLHNLAEQGLGAIDNMLLPIDAVISDIPELVLTDSVSSFLGQGQAVMVPHAPTEGLLRIYDENRGFLGIAEILDDGRIAPRRLIRY